MKSAVEYAAQFVGVLITRGHLVHQVTVDERHFSVWVSSNMRRIEYSVVLPNENCRFFSIGRAFFGGNQGFTTVETWDKVLDQTQIILDREHPSLSGDR